MAVEIKGIESVMERLEDLGDVSELQRTMQTACALVEGTARKKAPKKTGALRRSIESKTETDGENILGIVFTPLEYAPYVEYGTGLFAEEKGRKDVPWHYQDEKGEWHSSRGQKPQPFLRPAINENREEIVRLFKEGMRND